MFLLQVLFTVFAVHVEPHQSGNFSNLNFCIDHKCVWLLSLFVLPIPLVSFPAFLCFLLLILHMVLFVQAVKPPSYKGFLWAKGIQFTALYILMEISPKQCQGDRRLSSLSFKTCRPFLFYLTCLHISLYMIPLLF